MPPAQCTVSEIRAFGCQHTWWDRRSNYFMLKEFFAESHKLIRSNLFMLNAIHGGICTISNHPRSNHTRSNHPRLNHTRSNHPRLNHVESHKVESPKVESHILMSHTYCDSAVFLTWEIKTTSCCQHFIKTFQNVKFQKRKKFHLIKNTPSKYVCQEGDLNPCPHKRTRIPTLLCIIEQGVLSLSLAP